MEKLYINGKSLTYCNRNSSNQETGHFRFHKRLFIPFKSVQKPPSSQTEQSSKAKVKCPLKDASDENYRKVLKRPKKFKNYYTDRQPLSITRYEFPRFGDQLIFRGRQALCKYYNHNEIINEKLFQIRSAKSIHDIEKILNKSRYRHRRDIIVKSIEPYYDSSAILAPFFKPLANGTCLYSKDYYRLNYNHEDGRHQKCKPSPLLSKSTTNAIRKYSATNSSLERFICLASECYNRYIKYYLNNLNDCNKKVEKSIKRQSQSDQSTSEAVVSKLEDNSDENKEDTANDQQLIQQFSRLSVSLQHKTNCGSATLSKKDITTRQSFDKNTQCKSQDMSCSDTNNINTECTNHLKEPPKIIFSDFSTAKQQTQDKSDKDISDNRSAIVKSCLAIPISRYCSEARPP